MKKNRYEAPAVYSFKLEPQQMLDDSLYVTGTVTKPNETTPVNDQADFRWGGYNDDNEYVSDAKKGGYNPWTDWD